MISKWFIPVLLAAGAVIGFCWYGIIDPPDHEYQRGFEDARKQYKAKDEFSE